MTLYHFMHVQEHEGLRSACIEVDHTMLDSSLLQCLSAFLEMCCEPFAVHGSSASRHCSMQTRLHHDMLGASERQVLCITYM